MGNGPMANNRKTEIEGDHIVYYEFRPLNNMEDHPFFYRWVEYKRELVDHIIYHDYHNDQNLHHQPQNHRNLAQHHDYPHHEHVHELHPHSIFQSVETTKQ